MKNSFRLFKKKFSRINEFDLSKDEERLLKNNNCECSICGLDFSENKNIKEDFTIIEDEDKLICWDCYDREYLIRCVYCENSFENPKTPEETILYFHKDASKEYGYPIGIYQVLSFPYYMSDYFSTSLFDNSIKQVSKINLNKIDNMSYSYHFDKENESGHLCKDCSDKFLGKKHFINTHKHYVELFHKKMLHVNISVRGLIKKNIIK